jgi:hypothetical protein
VHRMFRFHLRLVPLPDLKERDVTHSAKSISGTTGIIEFLGTVFGPRVFLASASMKRTTRPP